MLVEVRACDLGNSQKINHKYNGTQMTLIVMINTDNPLKTCANHNDSASSAFYFWLIHLVFYLLRVALRLCMRAWEREKGIHLHRDDG